MPGMGLMCGKLKRGPVPATAPGRPLPTSSLPLPLPLPRATTAAARAITTFAGSGERTSTDGLAFVQRVPQAYTTPTRSMRSTLAATTAAVLAATRNPTGPLDPAIYEGVVDVHGGSVVRHRRSGSSSGSGSSSEGDGEAKAASFSWPSAIAFDAVRARVYVGDFDTSAIRVIDANAMDAQRAVRTLTRRAPVAGLRSLTLATEGGGDGGGYVFWSDAKGIMRMSLDGGECMLYSPELPNCGGLLWHAGTRTLIACDTDRHRVCEVAADGSVIVIAGARSGGVASAFSYPMGCAMDMAGWVVIADLGNHRIRRLWPHSGQVMTLAGTGVAGCHDDVAPQATFSHPQGCAISGRVIYVSQRHAIRMLTPVGAPHVGGSSGTGGGAAGAGAGVAVGVGGAGGFVVSTLAGGLLSGYVDAPGTLARFGQPAAIAVLHDTVLLVADSHNQRIRTVELVDRAEVLRRMQSVTAIALLPPGLLPIIAEYLSS